jgi:hypothetical protein
MAERVTSLNGPHMAETNGSERTTRSMPEGAKSEIMRRDRPGYEPTKRLACPKQRKRGDQTQQRAGAFLFGTCESPSTSEYTRRVYNRRLYGRSRSRDVGACRHCPLSTLRYSRRDPSNDTYRESGEDLLVASQRAWISCQVVIDEDLTYDVNGARFTLGCRFKNTGHSPARKVLFNAVVFPNLSFDHRTEQNRVCADAETHDFASDVFPEEQISSGTVTYICDRQIKNIQEEGKSHNNTAFISPFFVTCISYKIVGNEKYHHTPRIFNLFRGGNKAININDGTVPKEELTLKIWPKKEVAAD